jgi:hypothetical protein
VERRQPVECVVQGLDIQVLLVEINEDRIQRQRASLAAALLAVAVPSVFHQHLGVRDPTHRHRSAGQVLRAIGQSAAEYGRALLAHQDDGYLVQFPRKFARPTDASRAHCRLDFSAQGAHVCLMVGSHRIRVAPKK